MKSEYINPFLKAAVAVLEQELSSPVSRGEISLKRSSYTTHDVTVVIGVTGAVEGTVLLCLSQETACDMVGKILGQPFAEFDELAQSGTAEVGNVITGSAGAQLADAGFHSTISPPTIVIGSNTMVSTLDLPRIVIPLGTCAGPMELHVALNG